MSETIGELKQKIDFYRTVYELEKNLVMRKALYKHIRAMERAYKVAHDNFQSVINEDYNFNPFKTIWKRLGIILRKYTA